MTISSEVRKSGPYTGNGVTTAFDYEFKISDESHIEVILTTDGVEAVVDPGDYVVSGVGGASGGQVTFNTAPASGVLVTIILDIPFTQELDLQNQGAYYAEDVESAFDLAAQRDLQLQEQIDRSVKIPASSDSSNMDTLVEGVINLQKIESEITNLSGISADVSAVAAISADVSAVAAISGDVSAVSAISGDVSAVSAISADVSAVSAISGDVTAVSAISGDVTTVSAISDDVSAVSAISADVSTVAANIADIQNAEANAQAAAASAALANLWAEEDEDVEVATGKYSAKHWAAKAEASAGGSGVPVVATRTALKALDTTTFDLAYLNEGDREGLFVWNAGDYSSEVTADTAEGLYIKADAVASSSGAWVREGGWVTAGVDVGWFGAVGNGATDDSAAIQAAIDTGYNVNLAAKSYKVTGLSLTNNYQELRGASRNTYLLDSSATADLISIGNGTDPIYNVNLTNFSIWAASGVTKTAGHCVYVFKGTHLTFRDVYFGSIDDFGWAGASTPLWNGVYFDRFAECRVLGGGACVQSIGIKMRGNADQSFGFNLLIDEYMRFVYCGNCAVEIGGACGGVNFGSVDMSACAYGVRINKLLQNAANREAFFNHDTMIDGCEQWGVAIADNAISLLSFQGWCCSNGTETDGGNAGGGIYVENQTSTQPVINVTGATIYYNIGDGLRLVGGEINITGSKIYANGLGADGGCGVAIEGYYTRANIVGNNITNNGNATRGTNVRFIAACTSYNVSNNDLRDGGDVNFYSATSPKYADNRIVANNMGWVEQRTLSLPKQDTLTIASGVLTKVDGTFLLIDTEGGAGSDDLDTINGGEDGDLLILKAYSSAHQVVCKDGTGNLALAGDFTLTDGKDTLTLIYNGTYWLEISRSNNA